MRRERFLFPTDFSFASRQALRLALAMAARDGACVDVLHVIAPPSKLSLVAAAYTGVEMPKEHEGARHDAELRLVEMLATVPTDGISVNQMIEPGDPAATIVRVATERASDLVVMGTHGRTGVVGAVVGSVAHDVVSCAPCPVLTVRGNERRGL
jgi:nucleotide-binding universal stress UspA family protein